MLGRISAILLASALILTGCKGNGSESASISSIYDSIAPMAEGTLVVMDDSYISNYYGIDTADLSEYVFAQSDDPKSAETIIMFRCADAEKMKTYSGAVENSLNQREEELANYDLPDEAKLVKNAKVTKKGDFVYLVISDKSGDMSKIIKDSI